MSQRHSPVLSYADLQAQNERLQRQVASQERELQAKQTALQARDVEIAYLQERVQLLLSKRYLAQSETLKHLQRSLFDESELEKDLAEARAALVCAEDESSEVGSGQSSKQRPLRPRANPPKRSPLPAHLKRVEILIDVSAADKASMGDDWECIGFESCEQLAVHQRQYFVKVLKRKKYVRKRTSADAQSNAEANLNGGIKLAPPAQVILPKALADASLLADVLTSKFVDAVSFVRTHKRLQREQIDIGYSTLCDWPIQLYERLKPWQSLWFEALRDSALWHLDETTLQVLKEPGRENTQKSYLWGLRGGPPGKPIVLFHYAQTRDYQALESWLRPALVDFHGAIVSDEHGSYNVLCRHHSDIKAHGGCWAHVRRKFADAAKGRRDSSPAHHVIKLIAALYKTDNALKDLSGEAKRLAREQHVKPKLEAIYEHLQSIAGAYLYKGQMNTAIGYALNNWHKLCAFIEHPQLPLDNNAMEQAIRPFTIGRKNWLFSGSPRGAHASAFLYSIIETAKANKLEPKAYLQALFERYPLARTDDERRALLPIHFQFS